MGWEIVKRDLKRSPDKDKAKILQRFFKTGKGEYGEGDVFLGISVPEQRKVAGEHWKSCSLRDVQVLLNSRIHEHRLTGLFILIEIYRRSADKREVAGFYVKNAKKVNNWDLVDSSAHKILGDYLLDKDRSVLYRLAKSKDLWERRISVISCFAFIAKDDFKDALKICELLLNDKHDLIHKATGWMLREIGKKDLEALEKFLENHCAEMPRTMLRYAIEKFPEHKRKAFLIRRKRDGIARI